MSLHLPREHPTRTNVRRLNGHQVVLCEGVSHPLKQSIGLTQSCSIDGIANRSGICKKRQLAAATDVLLKGRIRFSTKAIVLSFKQQICNGHQFLIAVIRKIEMMRYP
jgi:aerobic-type carbon monoxide dehydrogenase small subunit (CoxS/CutS family)